MIKIIKGAKNVFKSLGFGYLLALAFYPFTNSIRLLLLHKFSLKYSFKGLL